MSETVDLYADENEPKFEEVGTVYYVGFPRPSEIDRPNSYFLYVEVDNWDMVNIQGHSVWAGQNFKNLTWDQRTEVYSLLVEWELCEWKSIGPEDRELFATEKLRSAHVRSY